MIARKYLEVVAQADRRKTELSAFDFNRDVYAKDISGSVFHIAGAMIEHAGEYVIVYCEHYPTLVFEKDLMRVGPEYRERGA